MSLLLLDFVTEVTVTEVTIFIIFAVVLLQIVIFSFTDLHYVLATLSQVQIYIFENAKIFSDTKGNISVSFIISQKKNIAFFSNNAQHLRGPLELLNRTTCFIGLKKSVKSDILSLVTNVSQNSGRALYLNFFILLVLIKSIFCKITIEKVFPLKLTIERAKHSSWSI